MTTAGKGGVAAWDDCCCREGSLKSTHDHRHSNSTQAFDRDGDGTLEVSDLEDLLGVLKRVAGKPASAGTDTGTGARAGGAAMAGLGLEAAMRAMDKDHSGQVNDKAQTKQQ